MSRPLPKGLSIRQARLSDIESIARLLTAAPDDGSVYTFPHMLDHPDEMRRLHEGYLGGVILDPMTMIRVAVHANGGSDPDSIVGFSSWQKKAFASPSDASTSLVALWQPAETSVEEDANLPESNTNKEGEEISTPSKALVPNAAHKAGVRRARERGKSIPPTTQPCYQLNGLSVHPDHQRKGIGAALVLWGMDHATEEGFPVFTGGEYQGVRFYEKSLNFQRIPKTEYWLDGNGEDITREQAQNGNGEWKTENGGLSGADLVWCPPGLVINIDDQSYCG